MDDWIERSNANTLYHLERQARTEPGLVPFLGAGISMQYGLRGWGDLLRAAAPLGVTEEVEKFLKMGEYEDAAEALLQDLGADGFQNMVAASAGDDLLESHDFSVGTVSLLPLIARGPVITTNFDRVLERAFEAAGTPFESVISGPRPDLIVEGLHGNRRVLIKLHGDWQDRVGRTFARSDYDANYGRAQPQNKRALLEAAETLLFSSRSLLFVGASLEADRTTNILEEVHARYAAIRHFAIMSVPTRDEGPEAGIDSVELREKEKRLATRSVLPLWYRATVPQDHATEVRRLLEDIVERISVRTVPTPAAPQKVVAQPSRDDEGPTQTDVSEDGDPIPTASHFERVVRFIQAGRLTFFLGSAIHYPTALMAREFYQGLARVFECEGLGEDRSAIAQYIVDRHGRQDLNAEVRRLLHATAFVPRETHRLFADWANFRDRDGQQIPFPLILTTNYDNELEKILQQAGVPYHLLSFQSEGMARGLFYHRMPNGTLRIIEQPECIRSFGDEGTAAMVVVKLNGGLDSEERIPECYSTTRLDYWDLASRIPDVLPAAVRAKLQRAPLLFLGHGLAEADVESLVRFAHKPHQGPRSWAVVNKQSGVEYWRQCGVEVMNYKIAPYVQELHTRLREFTVL